MKINKKIECGNQRGKPRLDSDITIIQMKNTVTKTQTMTESKFTIRA